MWQSLKQNLFVNRAKYAHILAAIATALAGMWATDQKFRSAVTAYLQAAPHWLQALAGLATFVIPLYKTTRTLLGSGGAA